MKKARGKERKRNCVKRARKRNEWIWSELRGKAGKRERGNKDRAQGGKKEKWYEGNKGKGNEGTQE